MSDVIAVSDFVAITLGILTFFLGKRMTNVFPALRAFNIPEAVTGGIFASLLFLCAYLIWGREFSFDLQTRDQMLVYFFAAIGLNVRISDLMSGGKPLLYLVVLTIGFIFLQNAVGLLGAHILNQPYGLGLLTGSTSLIGGHGTTIAWAPEIAANHAVPNALEIGIASATLGLVVASLIGGPLARILINRHNLTSSALETERLVGIADHLEDTTVLTFEGFLRTLLVIHVVVIAGYLSMLGLRAIGITMPLFVPCMVIGILASNSIPIMFKNIPWPARSKSLAFLSDFSLALFISMSMMSMQLWMLADLAGPLLVLLAAQAFVAVSFILLVVFPLMGRNYSAAVISAGFAGVTLGSTPTALANMTAVTKVHGPDPTSFIIIPLIGAFFVGVSNSFIIQLFLSWLMTA